jgi:hypothetical protein
LSCDPLAQELAGNRLIIVAREVHKRRERHVSDGARPIAERFD